MATQAPPPNSAFLAPRYWPTWIGIGALSLIAWLPFRLRIGAGTLLGHLTRLLARERRYITEVNIRLCFPELGSTAREALVRQSFVDNGIGLIETATGWIRPPRHFRQQVHLIGGEHIQAALDQGRGVLLLGAHYSTLDFSANLLSLFFPFAVTYRAHKNPLFDAFMLRGRIRNCNGVFDRRDIRGAFRHLKQGKILWYAPDQDYGPEQAVFAPFFGNNAATITAGSRFAAFNDSTVLVVSHRRVNREQRYVLEAAPLNTAFPSGDDVSDATLVNALLEREIRKAPAQYLWMHKRFKTQPGGKPESPYIFIRTPNRKLSRSKYELLTEGASPIAAQLQRQQLPGGLQLWRFHGQARGIFSQRHPALRLDRLGKHLRQHGLSSITVDSIFRVPHLKSTVVTVFVPAGEPAGRLSEVDASAAADFLLRLHRAGCNFISVAAARLLWDGSRLALGDPACLRQFPGSTALHLRIPDLLDLAQALGFDPEQRQHFIADYLSGCPQWHTVALKELLAAYDEPADNAAAEPHGTQPETA